MNEDKGNNSEQSTENVENIQEPVNETVEEIKTEMISKEEHEKLVSELTNKIQKTAELFEVQLQKNMDLHKKVIDLGSQVDILSGKCLEDGCVIHSFILEGEDLKPVEVKIGFKTPSPKIRVGFASTDIEAGRELLKLKEEWNNLGINDKLEDLTEEDNVKFMEYKKKKQETLITQLLTFFKLAIDDNQCITEQKEWLRSSFTSEFYQNINLEEVQKCIASFRLFYQI